MMCDIPENAPPGFKLMAWEGVGLYVPQRWEIGRHEGDHRQGLFRVDDESRVVIQARWWTATGPIPIDELVRQHARTIHGRQSGPPPRFTPVEGLGLAAAPGDRAVAFESDGGPARAGREILVILQKISLSRVLMLRFLIEQDQPDRSRIRAMLSGLRLQGADAERDWAVLDFAVQVRPGYRLNQAVIKAGVCYLDFYSGRRHIALRRFSAADAVMGVEAPGLDDLERWCRLTYSAEFYDMRYAVERTVDPAGRPLLRLTGKRRLMAPIELKWLIPKHRRIPARIDVIWDAGANKIYCIEILKPAAELEPDIAAFERAVRMTLTDEPAVISAVPENKTPRQRSLHARVQRSGEVTFHTNEKGRIVITYPVQRPRGLRLLRLLGGLVAGPGRQDRTLELDLIGSLVWAECGRHRRVSEIIELLAKRFRISHREAELSVTDFIRVLGSRGLLSVVMERVPKSEN